MTEFVSDQIVVLSMIVILQASVELKRVIGAWLLEWKLRVLVKSILIVIPSMLISIL